MELSRLQTLLPEFDKLHTEVTGTRDGWDDKVQCQYNTADHEIMKKTKRPDKVIKVPTAADPKKTEDKTVYVSRLAVPMQKLIVSRAAAFLCGNPIILEANMQDKLEEDLMDVIIKTWDDNKLDFESKKMAKLMMSETEVAELWYTEEASPEYWEDTPNAGKLYRLRMKILANKYGDRLYPVFNSAGDMIAFGREYVTEGVTGQDETHFDVYTDDRFYYGTKNGDRWDVEEEENIMGKIPVIYYSQELPEWADVQPLIERFETLLSNHSDTNDYNGSPTLIASGEIKGFATKGESGKVFELDKGADMKLLSWDSAPESIKMEYQNLRSLIFDMTDTPDISFEQMKSLGTYSGIALKMLFLGAHMKASDKEETFGKGVQRRINYIKAAMAVINTRMKGALPLSIKPKFEYYLPKNDLEKLEMLSLATVGKAVMSRKTAVSQNPLIADAEAENTELDKEAKAAPALDEQFT